MHQSIPVPQLVLMGAVVLVDLAILPLVLLWQRKRGNLKRALLGAGFFLVFSALLEPLLYHLFAGIGALRAGGAILAVRAALIGLVELGGLLLALRLLRADRDADDFAGFGAAWGGAEALCVGIVLLVNLKIWITLSLYGPSAVSGLIYSPEFLRPYAEPMVAWMTVDTHRFLIAGLGIERLCSTLQHIFCAGWLFLGLSRGRLSCALSAAGIFLLYAVPAYLLEYAQAYASTVSFAWALNCELSGILACALAGVGYYRARCRALPQSPTAAEPKAEPAIEAGSEAIPESEAVA